MYRGWTGPASLLFAGLPLLFTIAAKSEDAEIESRLEPGSDANQTAEDVVAVLTKANFRQTIEQHDRVLVNFYAHWEAASKRLDSEYEQAARVMKKKGMKTLLVKIDADADAEFAMEQGFIQLNSEGRWKKIKGLEWPVLWYYKNGDRKTEYKGEKKAAAIADWLSKKEALLIQEILEDDADRFVRETSAGEFAVIARVKPKSARDKAYRKMVEEFLVGERFDNLRFATIPLPKEVDPKSGASLTMWRIGFEELDSEQITYESTWSAPEMSRWVLSGTYPTVGNGFSASGMYGSASREELGIDASVIAILPGVDKGAEEDGSEEMRFEMLELLAPLAQEHSKWRFTTARIDVLTHDDLTVLGISSDSEPAICVLQGKRRYLLEGKDAILQPDAVKDFLGKVKTKKARAFYRSGKAPKKLVDKDGVTTLTGRTFEDHVLDPKKDVFVKFYTSHERCSLCKDMAPEWKQLAERVKKEGWSDRVVIAQINGTENEIPEDITIYPAVLLYPAGKADKKYKNKQKYSGVREYSKMFKFLVDKAKNIQDVEDAEEKVKRKGKKKPMSYAEREYEKRKRAMEL